MTKRLIYFCTLIALGQGSQSVFAVPISLEIAVNPAGGCDPVVVPSNMHELGVPATFPANESIGVAVVQTDLSACPADDNAQVPNWRVSISNFTGTAWTDLFFVEAGPAKHSNHDDQLINVANAFRIDAVGNNQPLILESLNPNGIFDVGEVWNFIVQDYQYLPVFQQPGNFNTPGLVGVMDPQDSIVARQVPEPSTFLLGAAGVLLIMSLRRTSTITHLRPKTQR